MKLFLIILLSFSYSFAQVHTYKTTVSLIKAHKYKEALPKMQVLLKEDSLAEHRLEYASICYSKVGHTLKDEKSRMAYYSIANKLSVKAARLRPSNPEAHYARALALGRMNENAGSKEKIANSKLIKAEIDQTLKLDPSHAGAYHILGRWHRTVANLSAMEKIAINTLFGGVPEGGSLKDAEQAFVNAIRNEPRYKLHYYELALTYKDMGNDKYYKAFLKKALEIPAITEEDPETDKKIRAALGL